MMGNPSHVAIAISIASPIAHHRNCYHAAMAVSQSNLNSQGE